MTDTTTIAAGLTLARELLEGDCSAFVECHMHPVSGLSPADEHVKTDYATAIAAITGAAAELQRLQAERDALAAKLAGGGRTEPAMQLLTSDSARAEVAEFFEDYLKRHDFRDYIARDLAGDFACALAPILYAVRGAPQPPAAEPARQPLTPDGCGACGDACQSRGSCRLADESPQIEPLPTIRTGRYRHYKGGEYRVLGLVRHSEYIEPMVLYRSLGSDGGDWVRPFGMFFGTVEHEGKSVPRFEPLEDEPELQALTAAQRELLAALRVRAMTRPGRQEGGAA